MLERAVIILNLSEKRRSLQSSSGAPSAYVFVFILFLHLSLSVSLTNCSSSGSLILSSPEGAEVSTMQGEVIGKTPLTLSPELMAKINDTGHLNFKLAAAGHVPRVVTADAGTTREVLIKLVPSSPDSFKAEFSKDFSLELNRMLRASYAIQKLVSERKIPEALVAAEKFKTDYPQLAFGYMIAAHLALAQNKREEAKNNLFRAQALDPEDPAPAQALKLIEGGKAQ